MDEKIRDRLLEHFDSLFPSGSGGSGPFWSQDPYRTDLFSIFRTAYPKGHLHGDHIAELLREQWYPQRPDLTEDQKSDVWDMCQAWSEWLYAWEEFGVPHS